MGSSILLFACLVAADLVTEFLLLPSRWKDEGASPQRVRSVVAHVAVAWALAGRWEDWTLAVVLFVGYSALELLRMRAPLPGWRWFLAERVAYGLLAWIAAAVCVRWHPGPMFWLDRWGTTYLEILVLAAGGVVTVFVGGILTAFIVRPFSEQLEQDGWDSSESAEEREASRGLVAGGSIIGRLERALIYVLVVSANPAGIGFLVAAKSILRFGEVKNRRQRMEAEYIIIGTLASFTLGVSFAFLTVTLYGLDWTALAGSTAPTAPTLPGPATPAPAGP